METESKQLEPATSCPQHNWIATDRGEDDREHLLFPDFLQFIDRDAVQKRKVARPLAKDRRPSTVAFYNHLLERKGAETFAEAVNESRKKPLWNSETPKIKFLNSG